MLRSFANIAFNLRRLCPKLLRFEMTSKAQGCAGMGPSPKEWPRGPRVLLDSDFKACSLSRECIISRTAVTHSIMEDLVQTLYVWYFGLDILFVNVYLGFA